MVRSFQSKEISYDELEENEQEGVSISRETKSSLFFTLLLLHISTALILLLGVRTLYQSMSAHPGLCLTPATRLSSAPAHVISTNQPITFNNCGASPHEALERNCRFELHNFAWVPPECYDEEISKEWYDNYDWPMSLDRDGQQIVSKEEAQKGNVSAVWVTWPQHVTHCGLVWRKYHRSVMLDRPMDNWTNSYFHTNHCGEMMVKWDYLRNASAGFDVLHLKFPTCDYSWKEGKLGQVGLDAAGGSGHHHHNG
jgi:hypothetical protein